ncbi:MAG: hypothetical protein CMJ75_06400 [Planctomycetaceae bacterium]|nr:hypothetical protein [Planctomycetaceae bacterium]
MPGVDWFPDVYTERLCGFRSGSSRDRWSDFENLIADGLAMRYLLVLPFIALTFVCWGIYGPVLHKGQVALGEDPTSATEDGKSSAPPQLSRLRPFVCVGLAYFLVAVVVPLLALRMYGEQGKWTSSGAFWSLAAGAAGAMGALGIIMAFKSGGKPVYVMPLVFGLAPVVNTLATIFMNRSFRETSRIFLAAIIVVALGAAGVMFFSKAGGGNIVRLSVFDLLLVVLSILLTALCWGIYGPVLHRGQVKMEGSRLRPLLCVGLAYLVIAVIIPTPILITAGEVGSWQVAGTVWSLAGGAAGAVGALGIILAFHFGGKPILVMPLVFGIAPVINTAMELLNGARDVPVPLAFYVSLVMVAMGAVGVLVFAPKPQVH